MVVKGARANVGWWPFVLVVTGDFEFLGAPRLDGRVRVGRVRFRLVRIGHVFPLVGLHREVAGRLRLLQRSDWNQVCKSRYCLIVRSSSVRAKRKYKHQFNSKLTPADSFID